MHRLYVVSLISAASHMPRLPSTSQKLGELGTEKSFAIVH